MSFIGGPNTDPLNVEAIEAKMHEAEQKAACYAQQHPDEGAHGPGRLRKALDRARAAFTRRPRSLR